jgi:proline iminopeptidase
MVRMRQTGFVKSDGFTLRYIAEGTGRPALVVGSALYYSRLFSTRLREELRMVFMDHRGFAPAPEAVDPATTFALERFFEDMERVRRTLALGPVVAVGHSGHAYMALEYAKACPASVSHVVMIGIAPDLSPASVAAMEHHWEAAASPERKSALAERIRNLPDDAIARLPISPGRQFFQAYIRNGPKAWHDPRFDATALLGDIDVNMDMFNHVWGTLFRDIDVTRGIEQLRAPVFLALGRHDFLVAPPASWDRYRSMFPDLTIRIFEHSGHSPQYEEAALFDETLIEWLKQDRT